MRFEILGTLRHDGNLKFDLSRRREGRILGALLLVANRPVSTEQLIDLLWPDTPPATARQQVQNCVTSLARLFAGAGLPLRLERHSGGYLLHMDTIDLDTLVFEDEVTRAEKMIATDGLQAAAKLLRTALQRWRGEVLLGAEMGPFTPAVVRLMELRRSAIDRRFGIELRLGRHREMLADLAEAVTRDPTREVLVGQAMTALSAVGRVGDALDLFDQTCRLLRNDLGIGPGPQLQALRQRILHTQAMSGGHNPVQELAKMLAAAQTAQR